MNEAAVLEIESGRPEMKELEEMECLFDQNDALLVALGVSLIAVAFLLT